MKWPDYLNERTIIKADYAGSGKTTACKSTKLETLFVSPFNKLCQKLKRGYKTITLHKLLGYNQVGKKHKNVRDYDISPYEAICF